MNRPATLASLLLVVSVLQLQGTAAFDLDVLRDAYARNNADELPVVSWMNYGIPKFLLYSDGTIMAADRNSKSGLVSAKLEPEQFRDALTAIAGIGDFWLLDPGYKLTDSRHEPLNIVTVRIAGRSHHSVAVYGMLQPGSDKESEPPPAFVKFLETLTSLMPEEKQPWDPGYVEILWSDYDYAPDRSLPWPSEWPGLDSPLVRPMNNEVIRKIMIFPASTLPELDAFLARRPYHGAILISGRRMSASYRWPLRGEKGWSSWKQ